MKDNNIDGIKVINEEYNIYGNTLFETFEYYNENGELIKEINIKGILIDLIVE